LFIPDKLLLDLSLNCGDKDIYRSADKTGHETVFSCALSDRPQFIRNMQAFSVSYH